MKLPDLLLTNENVFHNCISALSDLEYHHKEARDEDSFTTANKITQKHVRMLDALSMLLIYQGSGEVCATTFNHNISDHKEAIILWVKNNPAESSQSEQQYIANLCKSFESRTSIDDILEMCVEQCWDKILHRCSKVSRELKENNLHLLDSTQAIYNTTQTKLRLAGVIGPSTTLRDGLQWFLKSISAINTSTKISSMCLLIGFAAVITSSEPSLTLNPTQERCVKKLGAYRRIVGHVLNTCKEAGITSLKAQQVPAPAQREITIYTRTQDALNSCQPYIPEVPPINNFNQVKNQYDGASKGHGNSGTTQKITGSQHCELTLALYMLKIHRENDIRGPIKIGCSKASCYWCHVYLLSINDQFPGQKVVTFATHGKRTKGWLLPENDLLARDEILHLVGDSVEDVFRRAWGMPRKKSDSRSLSSSFEQQHGTEPKSKWLHEV